jgi:hypothetical protein
MGWTGIGRQEKAGWEDGPDNKSGRLDGFPTAPRVPAGSRRQDATGTLGAAIPRGTVNRGDAESERSISVNGVGMGFSALVTVVRQVTKGDETRGRGGSKSIRGIRSVAANSGAGAHIGWWTTATTRYPVTHPRASSDSCLNAWRTSGTTNGGQLTGGADQGTNVAAVRGAAHAPRSRSSLRRARGGLLGIRESNPATASEDNRGTAARLIRDLTSCGPVESRRFSRATDATPKCSSDYRSCW